MLLKYLPTAITTLTSAANSAAGLPAIILLEKLVCAQAPTHGCSADSPDSHPAAGGLAGGEITQPQTKAQWRMAINWRTLRKRDQSSPEGSVSYRSCRGSERRGSGRCCWRHRPGGLRAGRCREGALSAFRKQRLTASSVLSEALPPAQGSNPCLQGI